jgi:hypothetical protein
VLTRQTGQILRLVGLLIEILCLYARLAAARAPDGFWAKIPGFATLSGIILGFVVWAVGTFAILRARRPKRPTHEGQGGGWLSGE